GSCDPASEFEEQAVQVLMLLRSRLAPVHGARSHIVNKLVMPVGQPVLLALAIKRDLGPLELAIGVTERASAVLFRFCRFDALRVSNGAGVLDRCADLFLVVLGQAAAVCALDAICERVRHVGISALE